MADFNKYYDAPFIHFKMTDDLYFIGSDPASVHILDTGEGLIVFDTGFTETLGLVIDGMHRLGLDPEDIIAIFLTHGHIDHAGGAKCLRKMSGAPIYINAKDRAAVVGENDLIFDTELGLKFQEYFEPDVLISDGDVFTFKDKTVKCVETAGHTAGATSFFFNVKIGGREYAAGLHGGMGINTLSREYLEKHGLPLSLRDGFAESMKRLNCEKVDVFLGNHMAHNDTRGRYERLKGGDAYAFVDTKAWYEANEFYIRNFEDNIIAKNI